MGFHTVVFPASLIATGDPWTLVDRLSVTEYLNYEDGKFSKSRGVGVFGTDAQSTEIPADVWRYYLLSVRPEQSDAEFRWSDLAARNNNELLNNLGNFCHRVLDFVFKRCGGVVPQVSASGVGVTECVQLGTDLRTAVDLYIENLEKCRLREGLKAALAVSSIGNAFFNKCAPRKCLRLIQSVLAHIWLRHLVLCACWLHSVHLSLHLSLGFTCNTLGSIMRLRS